MFIYININMYTNIYAVRTKESFLSRCGTKYSRDLSGRGTTRADDAQGTPTQSHMSPSILVYEHTRHAEYI